MGAEAMNLKRVHNAYFGANAEGLIRFKMGT